MSVTRCFPKISPSIAYACNWPLLTCSAVNSSPLRMGCPNRTFPCGSMKLCEKDSKFSGWIFLIRISFYYRMSRVHSFEIWFTFNFSLKITTYEDHLGLLTVVAIVMTYRMPWEQKGEKVKEIYGAFRCMDKGSALKFQVPVSLRILSKLHALYQMAVLDRFSKLMIENIITSVKQTDIQYSSMNCWIHNKWTSNLAKFLARPQIKERKTGYHFHMHSGCFQRRIRHSKEWCAHFLLYW